MESELAFAVDRSTPSDPVALECLWDLEQLLHDTVPHLSALSHGIFLANGGLIYRDGASLGAHLEYATPECVNPCDVVRYQLAGERIVAEAAAELPTRFPGKIRRATFYASSVDYSQRDVTWGSAHESYHVRDLQLMADNIIPHLVSRVIYTGAGGFDSRSPGIAFLLSPRVAHLTRVISEGSMAERGIFHTRDEPLSRVGHRMHLICGESNRSHRASWLKFGTTLCVAAALDAGERPAVRGFPRDPLRAMREFAGDPTCQVEVENLQGTPVRATEIQRVYLEMVERYVARHRAPDWVRVVCDEWGEMLERLGTGAPASVGSTLDWAIKWEIYGALIADAGFTWERVRKWTRVFERLPMPPESESERRSGEGGEIDWPSRLLHFVGPGMRGIRAPDVEGGGLEWDEARPFLDLRLRLFEVDTRYAQLGSRGLFERLDREGVLDHRVEGVDNIERAMGIPPEGSRARLRGECVRRHGGTGAVEGSVRCSWGEVQDLGRGLRMDLSDPFQREEIWQPMRRVKDDMIRDLFMDGIGPDRTVRSGGLRVRSNLVQIERRSRRTPRGRARVIVIRPVTVLLLALLLHLLAVCGVYLLLRRWHHVPACRWFGETLPERFVRREW